jgi:hypothetical protein
MHLATYVVVNSALVGFNLMSSGKMWAIYPILGWGIGVALHAVSVFNTHGTEFEKDFQKWRRKRKRELKKKQTASPGS